MEQTLRGERRTLINAKETLSLRRQCELLGVNRSSLYSQKKAIKVDDAQLLNEIRDIWERCPFYGYRRITDELRVQGLNVNHKRVQRLMVEAGIQAIFPGPNTSRRNKQHAIHPYLLRGIAIDHPDQVWMVDITYLRLKQGFVYLVAFIDVYSRYVVSWNISNTLETRFCIEALKSGLFTGLPEIINSDQGCQFTSEEWVSFLQAHSILISMTGKGRCLDNIYIERFWRSLKREEFYLNEYKSIKELTFAIKAYIEFYNQRRPHQSLDYKKPAEVYFGSAVVNPVDMWTSPTGQPAPFGTCG